MVARQDHRDGRPRREAVARADPSPDALCYQLPAGQFRQTADEWMWVSDEVVTPTGVDRIDDLLRDLEGQCVELRVLDSLLPLREVWRMMLHASGIRLRNAEGWSAT